MDEGERILVFGRGGWLGQALWRRLPSSGQHAAGPTRTEVDIRSPDSLERALRTVRPSSVINLAAARPGADEDTLEAVNVVGARHVALACARHGLRLVHVSTDALHDGRSAPYGDAAPANPLTPYGRSKAQGESAVLEAHPKALCVRTSLLWDPRAMDRGTRGFAGRIAAGEPCVLYSDEIRCPLPRDTLAEALLDLTRLDVSGPLNVAGSEALSRYDFGLLLLRHFGVSGLDAIRRVRAADLEEAGQPPRPRDLRLLVDRAEALLGRTLPGVTDVLRAARGP